MKINLLPAGVTELAPAANCRVSVLGILDTLQETDGFPHCQ